jgi:hypothetical protein
MNDYITEEKSLSFFVDYMKITKTIVTSEYICILDIYGLKAASDDLINILIQAQELIYNSAFKISYSILPQFAISNSQLEKIGEEEHILDNTIITRNFADVLRLINIEKLYELSA